MLMKALEETSESVIRSQRATLDAVVLDSAGVQDVSSVFRTDKNPGGFVADAVSTLLSETEADIGLVGTWSVNATGKLTVDIDGIAGSGAIASDGSLLALEVGGNDVFGTETELFRMLMFGFPAD